MEQERGSFPVTVVTEEASVKSVVEVIRFQGGTV